MQLQASQLLYECKRLHCSYPLPLDHRSTCSMMVTGVEFVAGQEAELVSQGGPSAGAQPSQAPAAAANQQGQQAEDDEPPPPEPIGRFCSS